MERADDHEVMRLRRHASPAGVLIAPDSSVGCWSLITLTDSRSPCALELEPKVMANLVANPGICGDSRG